MFEILLGTKKPNPTINTLVFFKDGTKDSYNRESDGYVLSEADVEFLDWFHLRKRETFMYSYKNGITIYTRSEIKKINIKFKTEE